MRQPRAAGVRVTLAVETEDRRARQTQRGPSLTLDEAARKELSLVSSAILQASAGLKVVENYLTYVRFASVV